MAQFLLNIARVKLMINDTKANCIFIKFTLCNKTDINMKSAY